MERPGLQYVCTMAVYNSWQPNYTLHDSGYSQVVHQYVYLSIGSSNFLLPSGPPIQGEAMTEKDVSTFPVMKYSSHEKATRK